MSISSLLVFITLLVSSILSYAQSFDDYLTTIIRCEIQDCLEDESATENYCDEFNTLYQNELQVSFGTGNKNLLLLKSHNAQLNYVFDIQAKTFSDQEGFGFSIVGSEPATESIVIGKIRLFGRNTQSQISITFKANSIDPIKTWPIRLKASCREVLSPGSFHPANN